MLRRVAAFLLAFLFLAGASCTPRELTPPGPSPAGLAVRAIQVDGHPLLVEVADTPETRNRGLMHRETLPGDQGMIFVFREPAPLSFWMKNTLVPLSIAFADATGRIVRIDDMRPLDLGTHLSGEPAQYALEVNQGWFEKRGIGPDSRITGIDGLKAMR